jgi:hypothetical protein
MSSQELQDVGPSRLSCPQHAACHGQAKSAMTSSKASPVMRTTLLLAYSRNSSSPSCEFAHSLAGPQYPPRIEMKQSPTHWALFGYGGVASQQRNHERQLNF